MEKIKIIIFTIGILILLVLLTALVLIILKIKSTQKFKDRVKLLIEHIRPERIKKIELIYQRLSIIAKTNPEFVPLFEKLSIEFDQIEEKFKILSQEIQEINLKLKSFNKKSFDFQFSKVNSINESLKIKISNFKTQSYSILRAEDFLRNEMSFCKEKLRIIIELYSKKRILLDKISPMIDTLNNELKVLTKKFDEKIEKGDNEEAAIIMEEVKKKIIQFGIIINEGPKIQSTIFGAIPKFIKELISLYKKAEEELNADLEHIDFKNTMIDLSNKFKIIKNNYGELNLMETKTEILILVKNIKAIERMINSEIKSRNVFVKNYNETLSIINQTLKQFVALKREVKKLPFSGKRTSVEMADLFIQLKIDAESLDETAVSFAALFSDKTIPFTSKVARLKILLNKNNGLITIMNELYELIWRDDVVKKTIQNKFMQAEHALLSLKAKVFEMNIILSKEEKEQLQTIEEDKNKLKSLLKEKPFNAKTTQEVSDNLTMSVSSYYKVVGGKIEMAIIGSDLIKEFAAKRAINQKINIEFTQAERHYIQGNYAAALNTLIDSIADEQKGKK